MEEICVKYLCVNILDKAVTFIVAYCEAEVTIHV
jgi:hypothetical protein